MINMLAIREATSIAIHLCVRLTQTGDDFYSTRKVAEELDLSIHHVAKVVQRLVKAKIVRSSRGKMGGVKLRMPPEAITIAAVHAAVVESEWEGCLLSTNVCAGSACSFGKWFLEENARIFDVLNRMTIQEVAASLTERTKSQPAPTGTTHET